MRCAEHKPTGDAVAKLVGCSRGPASRNDGIIRAWLESHSVDRAVRLPCDYDTLWRSSSLVLTEEDAKATRGKYALIIRR